MDPDQLGHLMPAEPEHDPPFAYARADVPVSILRTTPAGTSLHARLVAASGFCHMEDAPG
jgi:hypothetical protein